MYPIHHRNTRRFVADYQAAASGPASSRLKSVNPACEKNYAASLQPDLRPAARRQPLEDFAVIEFNLTAIK